MAGTEGEETLNEPTRPAPKRCEECYKRRKLHWLMMERNHGDWFTGWLCRGCQRSWTYALLEHQAWMRLAEPPQPMLRMQQIIVAA